MMPWNDGLEGQSLQIAANDHSPLRVLAGPGMGKTFTLIRRIARLLEKGVPPKEIFVSTFTRMAAGDLRRELECLDARGAGSVRATTIHARCHSILARSEVLEITGRVPRPLLEYEKRFLLEDLRCSQFGGIREIRKRLQAYEAAWARLQNNQPGWPREPVDKQFQGQLLGWLKFHKAMLIGELVPEALRFLRSNPAHRECTRFSHVLVDEYQDLNRAEQEFIQLIAKNARLTIIGDEDQSIYSFKHAHPEGIADFGERHPDTADETLDICRRCPTSIVEIANQLISNNHTRVDRVLADHSENGTGEIHVVQWKSMEQEAEGLAKFIKRCIETGQVKPGGVLVLAPRRQLGYGVRDALKSIDVNACSFFHEEVLDGDPTILAECPTQRAFTLLTLAANPSDCVALRCWFGLGSPSLRKGAWKNIRSHCAMGSIFGDNSLKSTLERIRSKLITISHGKDLVNRLRKLEEQLKKLTLLRGDTLLDALFPDHNPEFLQIREMSIDLGTDYDATELLECLRTKITQPNLPTDVDYVRVMSLHKSKGLTAELVVVIGCVEGLIPYMPKDSEHTELAAILEEQRRLFYVSITRSRNVLVLSSINSLPRAHAYKMGITVRHGGNWAETITSRFIRDLGPNCPEPVTGQRFLK